MALFLGAFVSFKRVRPPFSEYTYTTFFKLGFRALYKKVASWYNRKMRDLTERQKRRLRLWLRRPVLPVGPALFVPEAGRVHQLVHHNT